EDLDLLVTDADAVVAGRDLGRAEGPMHRVVFEKVRERPGIGEIVDGNDLDVGNLALDDRTDDAATDPSKTIDANLRCHGARSLARTFPNDANTLMGRRNLDVTLASVKRPGRKDFAQIFRLRRSAHERLVKNPHHFRSLVEARAR